MGDLLKTVLDAGKQAAPLIAVNAVTRRSAQMDTAVRLLINLHDTKVDALLIACSLATKGADGVVRPVAPALDYAAIASAFADAASARVPKAPEEPKKRPRKMKGSAWFGRPRTPPSEDEV